MSKPRRLRVERDPDRARLSATDVTTTAWGVQLPSGVIYIEWNREAFEPDDRAEGLVHSRYENVEDAEQATAGDIVFLDDEIPENCSCGENDACDVCGGENA
ncbi:hypothetical protein [Natronoglomus mannanivorans]|uniref:Uncharacterized protein n=1 Tax=Natronoglomus mannanivorans TaxID=2979990 RepID=A0AAP2Z2T4_9EURY|nr:hypothetical protein [Halobacteria archaeon AArc-xg1-1]